MLAVTLLIALAKSFVCQATDSDVSDLLSAGRELRKLRPAKQPPLVCVIVRTYWKHGPKYGDGLQRLIDSLQLQAHARCVGGFGCSSALLICRQASF